MGSKMQPRSMPSPDEVAGDYAFARPPALNGRVTSRLLGRIADALQVPPSALYAPPIRVGIAAQPDAPGGVEYECVLLLDAYRRIHDPVERRRLLALVQEAAERR
jgi:hypothetical protein